jgi:hypothetical protein
MDEDQKDVLAERPLRLGYFRSDDAHPGHRGARPFRWRVVGQWVPHLVATTAHAPPATALEGATSRVGKYRLEVMAMYSLVRREVMNPARFK